MDCPNCESFIGDEEEFGEDELVECEECHSIVIVKLVFEDEYDDEGYFEARLFRESY